MTNQEYQQFKEFIHKTLYETLDIEDYERILNRLNIPVVSRTDRYWLCRSGCHNINAFDGKPNLQFWLDSRSFHCYSECQCSRNLLVLVEARFKLIGQPKTRFECLRWICEQCNVPFCFTSDLERPKTDIYNWKSTLLKYNRNKNQYGELIEYDKHILDMFPKIYHTDWLDYGISEETLDKYDIRWYNYRNQIVIPCYKEDGALIGARIRDMTDNDIKYMPLQLLDGTQFNFPTSQTMYGCNFNAETIQRKKTCWLVESEKSVLKADTWFGDDNVTLALYGHELTKSKLKYLVSLGIEHLVIMLDSDYTETCAIDIVNGKAEGDNKEYVKFYNNVLKIYNACRPYMSKIEVVYNNQGYDGYKYSPFDFTREQFDILYENRERIEV